MMRLSTLSSIVLGFVVCWAAPASAAKWQYAFTPYVWATSLDGDAGVLGRTTSIEADFGDLVSFVDAGASFNLRGTDGTWSAAVDVFYVKLGDSFDTPVSTIDVEQEQFIAEAAVGYRTGSLVEWLFGARYQNVALKIDFTTLPDLDRDKGWTDPFVGVRIQNEFSNKWTLILRGDVGGFGVASDLTINVLAALGYRFSKSITGQVGYRYLDTDFEDGGFTYDIALHGAGIGVTFEF